MGEDNNLAAAVSAFGAATNRKLSNAAATGAPEDQLRTPLEKLVNDLAELGGIPAKQITLVGETTLAHLATRPDYSVTRRKALIGFIEVKAPGKGADPRKFNTDHDKRQWKKLQTLPNIIYTDGNSFSLWQDGELQGKVVHLDGNVETSGKDLAAPPALLALFSNFLGWQPVPPRNAKQLAEVSARLCRLLREEVQEELGRNNPGLTSLAVDWRNLLFPDASDAQFADGYAQAVTFGFLVARVRDITLSGNLDAAANELRKSSTLIGTALRLLIDNPDIKDALKTSLDTLARVLDVVQWATVSKGDPDAWLYFYEDFLEVYDNKLRKKTGSYYTPPEVVSAMVRLTDEALRDPELFGLRAGLAAPSVTICDPAVGTGTFLLGILRHIAGTIKKDQGEGAVGPAVTAAMERIFGFELQFGPFAVAQLRLLAELQSLVGPVDEDDLPAAKLYVTDTLGDPYAADVQFSAMVAPIGESRAEANRIKREQPITVVIGNPPYKDKARGKGGWIEKGSDANKQQNTPMDRWTPPVEWGVGAHTKHLKNLYVYFWRWAALKVFGTGWNDVTGTPDEERSGIVCFITVAGFLNGPGFQMMREELRRDCSAIWVIDCSPEGHQPEVAHRIFQGVQQPVCIVLAARSAEKNRDTPAQLKFLALPEGHREHVKFASLAELSLKETDWLDGAEGWRDPFLADQEGAWPSFPALADLFIYNGSGVMPGRTWVIAPDAKSLADRWDRLVGETDADMRELLFHPHEGGDKTSTKATTKTLTGHEARNGPVSDDRQNVVSPAPYAFRTLDRQWLIPDNRILNRPNPKLWDAYSDRQIFFTAIERAAPKSGPAITLTGLVPDLDHYHGRGGRVYPLWRNAEATLPNVKPALLAFLATTLGQPVEPEDVMAYVAAVMAHPAFTANFAVDLKRPGLRVPLTADAAMFNRAVTIGREVIWLHTYGERFADSGEDRPPGSPRMPSGQAPTIPKGGTIPAAPEPLPETMTYDASKCRLHIGNGYIDNVSQQMWDYDVSGMNALGQWFSYRRRDRSRPIIGDRRPPSPLSDIQPEHWPHEYTTDLLDLLNVLGRIIALESKQAALLTELLDGPLLDVEALAGALDSASPGNS